MEREQVEPYVRFKTMDVRARGETHRGRGVMIVNEPDMPEPVLVFDQPALQRVQFFPMSEIESIEWVTS